MVCGAIEVVTIEEALNLPRASSVDGQTVAIVSTIQAFRVEDSFKFRKHYFVPKPGEMK